MTPMQIISGFLELLQDSPALTAQTLQDLPQLAQTINQFSEEQFDPIADAIIDWCCSSTSRRKPPRHGAALDTDQS